MNQLLILLISFSGLLNIQSDTIMNKYPVKSGKITYQYEGRNSCSEVIYFDDFGDLLYDLKTIFNTENGKDVKCSTLKILRQDTVFVFDAESNKISHCSKANCSDNVKQNIISSEMLLEMGYVFSGTEEVSGIICEKFNGDNGSMWIWNNIIIKSEMEIMEVQIRMVAIEIVTGISIEESIFELPANFLINKTN